MKRHTLLSFIFILLMCSSLSAQQKSRVAVLPFSAVETPASEARVVTSLFETALVKTGVYNVIEQNQISEILDAQAFSLSGCTDDACAVEVGKLLAAELIILGELSKVGNRYIANAKIIDVGLGRNVNADSVSADDIAGMTDTAVNLLAYKLAGLTYTEGGGERIADAFGEIYVSTDPDGAEVFINGMRRGTSPLVVDKVPLGTVRVTASRDNLVAETSIELLTADLMEVSLVLKISLGRMFIKSSEKEVEVFLDGRSLGPLSGGLFRDLPSGDHTVTLKGDGLIWEERVVLEADKTTTVEAYPRPYGTLEFDLPEDAVCVLDGASGTRQVSGAGTIDLTAGSYRVRVTGEPYLPYEDSLEIRRGEKVSLSPGLAYTEEYRIIMEEQMRAEARTAFIGELDALEMKLADNGGGLTERTSECEEARDLRDRIGACGYDFPDLYEQSTDLSLLALGIRIDELKALASAAERKIIKRNVGAWTALGIGAVGLTVTGILSSMGATEYQVYLAADTTDASEASREILSRYTVFSVMGAVGGGIAAVTGLSLLSPVAGPEEYETEIATLAAERAALEGGM